MSTAMHPHRIHIEKAIAAGDGLHTVADIARRWGISKARADELAKRPDFPTPLFRMGRSAVYVGSEVDEWRAQERRPGRPSRKE